MKKILEWIISLVIAIVIGLTLSVVIQETLIFIRGEPEPVLPDTFLTGEIASPQNPFPFCVKGTATGENAQDYYLIAPIQFELDNIPITMQLKPGFHSEVGECVEYGIVYHRIDDKTLEGYDTDVVILKEIDLFKNGPRLIPTCPGLPIFRGQEWSIQFCTRTP